MTASFLIAESCGGLMSAPWQVSIGQAVKHADMKRRRTKTAARERQAETIAATARAGIGSSAVAEDSDAAFGC